MNSTKPEDLTGKWLEMTLKNLAERAINQEAGTKELLFEALRSIVLGLEKGYIEDAFEIWIEEYSKLLISSQSIDHKYQNEYSVKDHQVCEE